jgi:hypothetical protein
MISFHFKNNTFDKKKDIFLVKKKEKEKEKKKEKEKENINKEKEF